MSSYLEFSTVREISNRVIEIHPFIDDMVLSENIDVAEMCSQIGLPLTSFNRKIKYSQYKSFELLKFMEYFSEKFPDLYDGFTSKIDLINAFERIQISLKVIIESYLIKRENISLEMGISHSLFRKKIANSEFNAVEVISLVDAIDSIIRRHQELLNKEIESICQI